MEIEVGEVWKDIEGYEGLYQVSNFGRIKSLKRTTKYQNSERRVKEKIKGTFIGKQGYLRVELSKNGQNRKYNAHTLVAKAFLNKECKKLEVNHINGIKTDNRVENLEWCTRSENELHAYRIGLAKNTKKQRETVREYCKNNKTKTIIQLDLNLNFIKEWKSAKEVEEVLEINRKNISQCITGRNKTAGGYIWVTKEQFKSVEYRLEE
ncbi:MAG: hypothetical protein HFH47_01840 [Bacilli bacterium]|nr:hypothetical protein [Bacilli bacterium]